MKNNYLTKYKFLFVVLVAAVYFCSAFAFYSSTNFEVEHVGIGFADRINEMGVKYQVRIYDEYVKRLKKREWFDKIIPYREIRSGYEIHKSNYYDIESIYTPYLLLCVTMSKQKYPIRREVISIYYNDIQ